MMRFRRPLHPKPVYPILVDPHDQQDQEIERSDVLQNEFGNSWNLDISTLVDLLPSFFDPILLADLGAKKMRIIISFQWLTP